MVIVAIVGNFGAYLIDPSSYLPDAKPSFGLMLWQFLCLVPLLLITIKRLNDRNHSHIIVVAWAALAVAQVVTQYLGVMVDPLNYSTLEWAIITPFALFALWILIENGFRKGTTGPNRYGPDPLV